MQTTINPKLLRVLLAGEDPKAVKAVNRVLAKTKGDVRAAAVVLGVHEVTLHRWLRLACLAGAPRMGRTASIARAQKAAVAKRRAAEMTA
jgi:hypothetical protein